MIVLASCGDGHIQIRLKDKKDTPTPPDPFVFRIKTDNAGLSDGNQCLPFPSTIIKT
jgi:hypothetical protein